MRPPLHTYVLSAAWRLRVEQECMAHFEPATTPGPSAGPYWLQDDEGRGPRLHPRSPHARVCRSLVDWLAGHGELARAVEARVVAGEIALARWSALFPRERLGALAARYAGGPSARLGMSEWELHVLPEGPWLRCRIRHAPSGAFSPDFLLSEGSPEPVAASVELENWRHTWPEVFTAARRLLSEERVRGLLSGAGQ